MQQWVAALDAMSRGAAAKPALTIVLNWGKLIYCAYRDDELLQNSPNTMLNIAQGAVFAGPPEDISLLCIQPTWDT